MSDNADVSSAVHRLLREETSPVADAACLAAARLGTDQEAAAAVETLVARHRPEALTGLVKLFPELNPAAKRVTTEHVAELATSAQRAARSDDVETRLAVAELVRASCHVSLVPTLATLLHTRDGDVAVKAVEALSHWIKTSSGNETRDTLTHVVADALEDPRGVVAAGRHAEAALVATAIELLALGTRVRPLADLIRRRGGPAAARLTAPKTASDVAACLAGAAAAKPIVAEALRHASTAVAVHFVHKAHLLSDDRLATTVASLQEGPFWSDARLADLLELVDDEDAELKPADLPDVATWVIAGGNPSDVEPLLVQIDDAANGRASLRLAIARRVTSSASARGLVLSPAWTDRLASSPDPRLARFAVRELARQSGGADDEAPTRGPSARQQAERLLLARCCASPSVRRACGPELAASFDRVFRRLVRLQPATAKPAGQVAVRQVRSAATALLKLVPDASRRLDRLASAGPVATRMLALSLAEEAKLVIPNAVAACSRGGDAKLRARAATMLSAMTNERGLQLLRPLLDDPDPRVRANAVESLQASGRLREATDLRRLLHARERLGMNRERANAIVALDSAGLGDAERPLFDMLRDRRPTHRLSGIWAVGATRRWRLLDEVARIARSDDDQGVRRLATTTVRRVATDLRKTKPAAAKPVMAKAAAVVAVGGLTMQASAKQVDSSRLEALRGGFGKSEAPVDAGPWLAGGVMVISGGVAIGLIARKLMRHLKARAQGEAAMDRRLCNGLGLPGGAAKRLRRLAGKVDATSATTLLMCPSLLRRLSQSAQGRDRLMIDLALLRVA